MKKHLTSNLRGSFIAPLESKSKTKPREITMSEYMTDYLERRNETFTDAETMAAVNELRIMGVRDAPKHIVVTEAQDKAKKRKHEEITLQAEFCMWVKKNYPDVKFLRHEREKQRSNFMQNQMQVLNSAGSMPDWETTHVTDIYTGLLIEFKKPGEKWLMADGETIKTDYAFQYKCHVDLWKQRRVVYFCNDLAIAKLILQQYLEGRTMRQRVYKYPLGLAYLEIK